MAKLPTAKYLRECFSYDPETGELTWKVRPRHHFKSANAQAGWNARFAGQRAGSMHSHGYMRTAVNQVYFTIHRLIWVIMTGKWAKQLDHKNCDKADNRWANLRKATRQQNLWNVHRKGKLLPKGVSRARSGRYRAIIYLQGKDKRTIGNYLGTFDTPEEAHTVWCAAVRDKRGEFFHP